MQSGSSRQAELVICDKTIERAFGWLNRARRLAKDFEECIESSVAWIYLAVESQLVCPPSSTRVAAPV